MSREVVLRPHLPHLPRQLSVALVAALCGCGHPPDDPGSAGPAKPASATTIAPGDGGEAPRQSSSARTEPTRAASCPEISRDEAWLAIDDDAPPLPALDDPRRNLGRFFERWAEVARGHSKRSLRIAVYGDSNLTMDGLTAMLRRAFQARYGDAGHGFVALGRPWAWYRHKDVVHGLYESMWHSYATTTDPAPDNRMGFSGIAAESRQAGALSWVGTADADAPVGKAASRFGVYYLKMPGGGPFEIRLDGKTVREVPTRSKDYELGHEELTAEDGAHKIAFLAKGTVRLLGATLERDPVSVTVDSLGVGSLNAWALARLDTAVNRAMLSHRDYDLVIFLVGTNMYALEKHHEWMGRVLRHHRLATPNLPVLLMSPPDITLGNHGQKTDPRIVTVAGQLHDIAREHGTAYWDFRAAMGGDRSIVTFRKKKWAQADLIHFTDDGSFFMGRRLLLALWKGFLGELDAKPDLGCNHELPGR